MEQMLNIIPAEELFGTASQLVAQGGEKPLSSITSLGAMYQAATGMVMVCSLQSVEQTRLLVFPMVLYMTNKTI